LFKKKTGSKAGIHKIHDNAGIVKTSFEDSYLITYFFESFGSINHHLEQDFNSVRFGSCLLLFEVFEKVFIISEFLKGSLELFWPRTECTAILVDSKTYPFLVNSINKIQKT